MKARSLFLALCFMAATLPASAPEGGGPGGGAPSLMPWPQSLESKPGVHRLTQNLTLSLEACRDGRVTAAAGRLLERVRLRTGFPPQPPGADPRQASLILRCGGDGEPVQTPNTDESYILDISPGDPTRSPSPVGFCGPGIDRATDRPRFHLYLLPCLRIEDRPRFRWRGPHIDVARHWEPVDVILRNLTPWPP